MKDYFNRVIDLLLKLGAVLILFTITRLFFLFFNFSLFSSLTYGALLKAFVIGIRFDISVIIYFNLLIILLHILPVGKVYYNNIYKGITSFFYVFVNSFLLFVNLGDSVFFHFTLKRSTIDVLKFIFISDDILIQTPHFLLDYWIVPLLLVVFVVALVFVNKRINRRESLSQLLTIKTFVLQTFAMILILGSSAIGARGGIQGRPLSIMHASSTTNASLAPIVLNTPFTLLRTYGREMIAERNYFEPDELKNYYQVLKQPKTFAAFDHKNIVIILLESFSREYVGNLNNYPGYTPFLDSLSKHSLNFTNAFANGFRSMDALPAVLMSVPSLMNDAIITSTYNTNNFTSFGEILKTKSYSTAFFHGGNEGTLGLDGFAKLCGFDSYHGRTEYNNDADWDGTWGIYDEPFFQYVIQEIDKLPQPFIAVEFSLSSHYPYALPEKHQDKFEEGPLRIHRVVRYTDYALSKFFEVAKTKDWYSNTLFVISADHPAQSVIPSKSKDFNQNDFPDESTLEYYKNTSGRFAIPIVFFAPGDTTLKGEHDNTIQQTDIMPTILNVLNYKQKFIAFGNNVLDTTNTPAAFHHLNGLYQITVDDYCLLFDGNKATALYRKEDVNHLHNLINTETETALKLEGTLKAYLQEYSQRMIRNNLVDRSTD